MATVIENAETDFAPENVEFTSLELGSSSADEITSNAMIIDSYRPPSIEELAQQGLAASEALAAPATLELPTVLAAQEVLSVQNALSIPDFSIPETLPMSLSTQNLASLSLDQLRIMEKLSIGEQMACANASSAIPEGFKEKVLAAVEKALSTTTRSNGSQLIFETKMEPSQKEKYGLFDDDSDEDDSKLRQDSQFDQDDLFLDSALSLHNAGYFSTCNNMAEAIEILENEKLNHLHMNNEKAEKENYFLIFKNLSQIKGRNSV